MAESEYRLSKSKLLSYLQCPKRLYLEIHRRDLMADFEPTPAMVSGHQVGEVARDVYGPGALVELDDGVREALALTGRLVRE